MARSTQTVETREDGEPQRAGFEITLGKGFHIVFENGWTVSIQWGPYNYCEKHTVPGYKSIDDGSFSPDAEIAAWDAEGNWYSPRGWNDTVKGYQSPADVLAFINKIARKKPLRAPEGARNPFAGDR